MAKVTNNTNQYKNAFENACRNALNEIAKAGHTDLVANCVTGVGTPAPGTLKKGHHYKITGIKKVTWGNYVPYAPYVEFTNFKHKGTRSSWFRKTLRADTQKFNQILAKHLKKVGV